LNKEAVSASKGLNLLSQMKVHPTASSATDCKNQPLLFQDLGTRKVVADFSGGTLSSDGGVLLLRQADLSIGLTRGLAGCFGDLRHPIFGEHALEQLIPQRLYAEALGYEDVNDHAHLRRDPLLATACGQEDPTGAQRRFHPGAPLAAPSTLNRLELSNNKVTRCHKLPHDPQRIEALLLDMGARCLPKHAAEIVIDLDAMGHRLHGSQEGRHFNAYYDDYVYLPLYACVSADGAGAGTGLERDRTGPRHHGQRALEALESGGASPGERAPGVCANEQRLAGTGDFPALSSAADATGARRRRTRIQLPSSHRRAPPACGRRCLQKRPKTGCFGRSKWALIRGSPLILKNALASAIFHGQATPHEQETGRL
jgi:hypothetical protein